ncbi:L,D-transpeptidase family protein [Bartonella choladocola]|uniref:L,D-peptidoglycan transpeptidase YkuD, ErfK/YbiS/YcfS/YnhG family n=1 Tax=Bartonella choladocola TaxID=2750995 RepID=A0A1U9MEP6_9HYPH|nr:L,D-transpeptidase family protein [Bartonella choladocola]AQT46179.1 L,D-peptidoglycan transpeptidase YkuD, ErfK/YbiS/YcfS/YnhG family [Bartonella choladocola]
MQVSFIRNSLKTPKIVPFIVVRKKCGTTTKGILAIGQYRFPCALGRSGFTARKREGDGATPVAVMPILGGFRKSGFVSLPHHPMKLHRIKPSDGWCDEPWDANYNRPVRLPYRNSAEKLFRDDKLYDIALIPDWNIRCRIQKRGSAIFFHLAHPEYKPTEGCIAVSKRTMERILPFVSRQTRIMTLGTLTRSKPAGLFKKKHAQCLKKSMRGRE